MASATPIAAPTKAHVMSLLRSLLRAARNFSDYNVREYAKRRTLDGFRANRSLSDPDNLFKTFSCGVSQLEVAQRQSVLYSMFQPSVRSVLEIQQQQHMIMKDGENGA